MINSESPNIFFILMVCIVIGLTVINPVNATINVTVDEIGESYIKWSWNSGLTLINLSVDSYEIQHFDKHTNSFILSDIKPDESHSIAVYTSTDSGYNLVNTTSGKYTSQDTFWDFIMMYIFFIAGLICLFVGMKGEPLIGFGGFVFGCLVIIESLNDSFTMGFLGGLLIIASMFVVYNKT